MSDVDQTRLSEWLARTLDGFAGITRLEKFPGGQSNPTYRLDTNDASYVLRRQPFGPLLPSAHAVDREFRLLSALGPAGYPVPRAVALCRDAGVIGSMFYLMSLVDGRVYSDGTLPDLPANARRSCYEALVDALAQLHSIDHVEVGLGDFGAKGQYGERQVQRWTRQYRASQTDDVPEIEKLIAWLPTAIPPQERTSLIHGDYRVDNVVFAADRPDIRAVLDWELSTIGDPLADFANFALAWIIPTDGGTNLSGVDLGRAGIPKLDEMVARYCAATGRESAPDLHWYFSFNLFRLVAIIQGIKKRVADGNASNARAREVVERLIPLARQSWAQARMAGAID